MTPFIQFSLTFLTIVVLAVVVYTRLLRYERYMREEKEGILRLNERLQSLADGLESLGTRRVEQQLAEIHEVLEMIRQGLDRASQAFAASASASAIGGPGVHAAAPLDLRGLIEAKLYNLGYDRISVVSDLRDADAQEPVRVVVEAEKAGVTHKGHLIIHGSAVTEFEMQPSYTSFP